MILCLMSKDSYGNKMFSWMDVFLSLCLYCEISQPSTPLIYSGNKLPGNSHITSPDIRSWKNFLNCCHNWQTTHHQIHVILPNWNTTLFPAAQKELPLEKETNNKTVIRTFKGIILQWFQEDLVHINVLEVSAFKGTVQAGGKRVPIYGKEGSAHSANMPGAVIILKLKTTLNS